MTSLIRPFPLFENVRNKLVQLITNQSINQSSPQPEILARQLSKLSYEQTIHIVLIIIHYTYLCYPNVNFFTPELCDPKRKGKNNLPYGIVVSPGGRGFSLDLSQVPTELLLMLYTYLLPE